MPTMSITSWYQVGWSTDLEACGGEDGPLGPVVRREPAPA
jgi:hypothetical protein